VEAACKMEKLSESDAYICMVASKTNRSLNSLFSCLGIEENTIYQRTVIWQVNEKDFAEMVVQILNDWIHKTSKGRTLFELYLALKQLKYYHILHHLKPVIVNTLPHS